MPAPFDRGPLLGHSFVLGDGFRVRLRMARSSDLMPIRALLERRRGGDRVELEPLVQFDPRRRCVICATALIDSAETLVGVGSIDLDEQGDSTPDVVLVDEQHASATSELLVEALRIRAAHAAEARAA
jgi:hypothetical protein